MTVTEALRQLDEAQTMIQTGVDMLKKELRGQATPGHAWGYLTTGINLMKRFEATPFAQACQHGRLLAVCPENHR